MSEITLTLAEANARLDGTPTIDGRPTTVTLTRTLEYITDNLRSIPCHQSRENGYAGLAEPPAVQQLRGTVFTPPTNPGQLILPDDVPRGRQATLEAAHTLATNRYTTYRNLNDAIRTTLERCIQPMYRPEAIGAGENATWPMEWTALQIVEALQRRYQKVSPTEKTRVQQEFPQPFNQNLPIEQLFSRHENHQKIATMAGVAYTTEQLIHNVVDRLRECPLYTRAIEAWDELPERERDTWQACKSHFLAAYERILDRPAAARNAYANHAAESNEDEVSLVDTVVEMGTAFNSFGETYNSNVNQINDNISTLTESMANLSNQVAMIATQVNQGGPPAQQVPFVAPPVQPVPYVAPPPYAPPNYAAPAYQPPVAPAPQPPQRGRRGGRRNGRNQQSNANNRALQQYQPPPAQQGAIPPYQPHMGQQPRGRRTTQLNYVKYHNNWYVCYSCGFDVDHESHTCQNKKPGHRDDFTRHNHQEFAAKGWPFCKKGMHKNQLPTHT